MRSFPPRAALWASVALIALIGGACSSAGPSADRDCAAWGPAKSEGPVGDAAKGAGQGAVIGVVTGSVARGVVLGAARNLSACLEHYQGP